MKVLHVEDTLEDAELVRELLTGQWPECMVDVTSNASDLLSHLGQGKYDLILSDFSMGAFNGLDALRISTAAAPNTPFIFLSGTIGEDRAIEALQAGAKDYVLKDRMKRLITAIERALRDREERMAREGAERRVRKQAELLDKAHNAIIVTNLEGDVTYWNSGAERILGWMSHEIMDRTLDDLLGIEAQIELEKANAALKASGEWRGEIQVKDKNDKLLVVEFSLTQIRDGSGEPESRLCIGSDITSKKSLEEKFLRVQRLESIGMLASGIAHDLNNVLAPIFLAAPMLRDQVTDPGSVRMIATLEKSAERGAGLVRQILTFAQGVSGSSQEVQVKHIMRDTAAVIKETFPKNITLESSIPRELWPIKGNSSQVHQVLLNLCVNARDAMPNGGTLNFRAENCLLDERAAELIEGAKAGAWVTLTVEDTGTGIPPQNLTRIWDPFFTTKEVGKGTGLGLSTVRGIVENHKGFVILNTKPGRGTSFRVYLPAADIAVGGRAGPSVHPFAVRGNGELVLVVDDEAQIRETTAATLAHYGYRVLVAKDGTEALALFATRSLEIKVVVTDLNMPNLDGSALAKVLRQLNSNIRLLAITGLNAGACGAHMQPFEGAVVFKPFKAEALLLAVNKLLHEEPVSAIESPSAVCE